MVFILLLAIVSLYAYNTRMRVVQSEKVLKISAGWDRAVVHSLKELFPEAAFDYESGAWVVYGYDSSDLGSLAEISSFELVDERRKGPQLYPHQEIGVAFLCERDQALLADQQGLGKSPTAVVAADQVMGPDGQCLIVCPASVVYNWKREVKIWSGHDAEILTAQSKPNGSRYAIASYDTAKRQKRNAKKKLIDLPLRKAIKKIGWEVFVMDEAHMAKTLTSQRHRFCKSVKSQKVWQLTGTPILNRPIDLVGLLKIAQNPIAKSKHKFGLRYCNGRYNGYGWDYSGASRLEELAKTLSPWMLRRTKDEVLDLPPKLKTYQILDAGGLANRRPADVGDLMRLRAELSVQKAPQTFERVVECVAGGQKAIIFSESLKALDLLEKLTRSSKMGIARIDGSVSSKRRQVEIDRFQNDPNVRIFLGQTVAAGSGITLTASSYVFFNDLSLVPAYHLQAEDRAHRIGTTGTVNVYYHGSNSIVDEALWGMLEDKLTCIATFEGALEAPLSPQALLEAIQDR
jgi:SWI/SNF-related matrix-associated actin-dependent regulator 1 of chromatin subfamily A